MTPETLTETPETLAGVLDHVLTDLHDALQLLARLPGIEEKVTRLDETLSLYRPLLESLTGGPIAAYGATRRAKRNGRT